MKILLTEDDNSKRSDIASFLQSIGVDAADIISSASMAECASGFDQDVRLCIIDLRLPAYEGGPADANGIGVLHAIERLGGGRVKLLAISSFPEEFSNVRSQFESRGCILVSYSERDVWQSILRQMIIQEQSREQLDFLIFCALRDERKPFTAMDQLRGQPKFRENLSRLDVQIAGRSGSVVELPRMGLVDAAAHVALCIERFKPKLVAMSGICAGFPGRAALGQLLVSELAYEYQSGKWSTDGFSQEPYQVPVSESVRVTLSELLEPASLLGELETGWSSSRPSAMTAPKLAAFTSGSAVIASETFMEQVSSFHRRVAGLDMEVYAVHRAAHLAGCRPDVICAKTVVDLAGSGKDDTLQAYGCYISARFVKRAVSSYFASDQG